MLAELAQDLYAKDAPFKPKFCPKTGSEWGIYTVLSSYLKLIHLQLFTLGICAVGPSSR